MNSFTIGQLITVCVVLAAGPVIADGNIDAGREKASVCTGCHGLEGEGHEENPPIVKYAGFVEFMGSINNKATAYVCTNFRCNFPTTDPAKMLESLSGIAEKSQSE